MGVQLLALSQKEIEREERELKENPLKHVRGSVGWLDATKQLFLKIQREKTGVLSGVWSPVDPSVKFTREAHVDPLDVMDEQVDYGGAV